MNRCAKFLSTYEGRWENSRVWRRKHAKDKLSLVIELVLENVHPGNLGVLPPSPEKLMHKAAQIGLISTSEMIDIQNDLR